MKRLLLIALFAFSFSASFAGKIQTKSLVLTGQWKNTSTWDQNRLPKAGDTVIIALGSTVIVDDVQNIGGDIHLKIYGILKFTGGKISMGELSRIDVFQTGLIMKQGSPSETIRIGNELKFGKDDDAIIGPAYSDASTPNSPLAFKVIPGYESTLIVKISDFNIDRKNDNVTIKWTATDETNANMYELQRSFDGMNWSTIAYITPVGNVTTANNYTYTDKKITAKSVYYKLKHTDNNGRISYTQVRSVNSLKEEEVRVASMPNNKVMIQFSEEIKGTVNVYLTSVYGLILNKKVILNPKGQVVLDASVRVKGSYVLTITNNQNINISKQVIL